ncbi:hypothetical protein TRSC58_06643 [Trypanosoma rangeli SC58]|uniref:Uncharacterized protein n=1 Tax=Trypanosoma rangeli SC58 TaxID=429131 RepID=A0A061ISB7_TRYRA|nr:hypothetical protein TRSC58_06643 [Trypanosoma rangeli SC58]
MSVTKGDGLPRNPASQLGHRGLQEPGPDGHVKQGQEGGGGETADSSHKQQSSGVSDTLHASEALRNPHRGSDSGGSGADVFPSCESQADKGSLTLACPGRVSAGSNVPGLRRAEGRATHKRPSTATQWDASFRALAHDNESSCLGAENVAGLPDDANTDGGSLNDGLPRGGASADVCDGWGSSDNVVANETEMLAEPESTGRNANPHGMRGSCVAPASRARGSLFATDPPPRHATQLSSWRSTFTFSLRCWALCPLVVMLVLVAIITMVLALSTSRNSSQSAFSSLHEVVVANMEESVGRLTISKMARMVLATGSMYFSRNTLPNPRTDILMPLENGMMSRLCAVLRDMDPAKTVASLGAVSLTRRQAAVCINSRSHSDRFVGTVSQNGAIDGFYYIDPVTLEYSIPPEPLGKFTVPIDIDVFTVSQRFRTVIKTWISAVQKGEEMLPEKYWVKPRHPPTYVAFVYPFFEVYNDSTIGVGYMYATMFTDDLTSIQWYAADESGIRVMLVDPNVTAKQLLVLANSWGQPLSNVTNPWWAVVTGSPVKFMHVDDVEDSIMREALKHVDLHAVIASGREQSAFFPYGGFDGCVTAKNILTESGVEFLLVVSTTRSYYLGPVFVHTNVAVAVGVVVLLLVTAACIAFVECCLLRPLRATRAGLKLELGGAPVGARSRRRAMLREVQELEDVCNTLRCRLDEVRSYMPDRFNAKFAVAGLHGALRSESRCDGSILGGSASGAMGRVACSVAYVYYTSRAVRNPTNAVVELIMRAVVGIATDCGGCFEVQRPDYCVISFGVQSREKDFLDEASDAVEFAQRLRRELTACAELAGLYRVVVESGVFLSGIVSGGGRSHFVLLCRHLHHRVGAFLPYAGVVAAVTGETALLVRGHFRLLPFETVYLDDAAETCVRLHEVLDGVAVTAAWQDYKHCYSEAYDMMERGEYGLALGWWEKAGAVEQSELAGEPSPCRSSQAERLRAECVAHVARGDATPFVRRPRPANCERDDVFPSDAFSTATGKDTISGRMASLTGSFRGDAALTAPGSDTASLEVAAGCLPRQFTDHLGGCLEARLESD